MTISVRNLRTPAGGAVRGRRRKLSTGVLLLLGLFAGLIGVAPSAFAHHPEITVETDCDNEVTWTSSSWSNNDGEGDNSNVRIEYSIDDGAWTEVDESPISYDVPTNPAYDPQTHTFTVPGTPDHVEMRATAVADWGNGQDGGQVTTTPEVDFPTDCVPPANPSAEAQLDCDEQVIDVNFTGAGSATTVDIYKNGELVGDDVPVPVGPSTFAVDLDEDDENTTVVIDLDYAADSADDQLGIDVEVDCDTPPNPDAGVTWTCGAANATVSVTNDGDEPVTATISKNGSPVFTGVAVPGDYLVPITAADEDTTVVISVTFSDGGSGSDESFDIPVSCDEPAPTIAEPACADGGVSIVLGNEDGEDDATFTIVVDGVPSSETVAAGDSETIIIPVDEGDTVDISITSGNVSKSWDDYLRDCEQPGASLSHSCAAGGVVVNLTNTGSETTTIVVDGTPYDIAGGGSQQVIIPVGEGEFYSITVTGGDGLDETLEGTRDCEELSGSVVFECAVGGVSISVTNTGDVTTSIQINGGPAIDIAPGDTYTETIPVAEGDDYDVTVTGDGFNESASGTRNCEELEGTVVFDCAVGGVSISVTNTGDLPTSIQVNGGPSIEIAPGDTYTETIPVAEGDDYSVTVTGDGLSETASGTRDCEGLSGSVAFECISGGVAVSVTNTGVLPTSIQINGGASIEIAPGDTYTETVPVAEGDDYSVTVTGDGFSETASGTRDCEEPAVQSIELDCAIGGIVVVLTNGGELPANATVNGTAVVIPAADGDTPGIISIVVEVGEDSDYDFDVVIEGTLTDVTGRRDCERPGVVSATLDCAQGGVVVVLINLGLADTTVTVDGIDVVVPALTTPADPVEVLVPVAEDASYDFDVTGDELDENFTGIRDCEQPGIASANLECAEGGVVVVLTNDGASDTVVVVDGVDVIVPAGTTAENPVRHLVPVDEDAAYDFTVVGDGLDQHFSGTVDCLVPGPTVDEALVCIAGGLNLTLGNDGEDTATFEVASPGLPGGATEVVVEAGDTATVLIPVEEDASTEVTVTSGDEVLFDETVTRDCETVGGVVVPPALPTTGANTTGLLGLAGALLLAGLGFLTGARRREALLS